MDKAGIQTAFKSAGIARLAKDIDLLARTSIRLSTNPVDEAGLDIGCSKIGGMPDLPPTISWPIWKQLPQSFVAQLRLDEIHPYDTDHSLPAHGMLWFFYDAQQETFGESLADTGGWQVLFMDDDLTALKRIPIPGELPASGRFHACSLGFSSEITLSQQPQLDIPGFDWSDDELERYEKLLATFPDPADRAAIHNRLLGNPETLQDDMRVQCELAVNGVTDADDPRVEALSKSALDWRLLFQVDSDEHAGMRWASTGMLYYWIKAADLQAKHFARTWLVLQSE